MQEDRQDPLLDLIDKLRLTVSTDVLMQQRQLTMCQTADRRDHVAGRCAPSTPCLEEWVI